MPKTVCGVFSTVRAGLCERPATSKYSAVGILKIGPAHAICFCVKIFRRFTCHTDYLRQLCPVSQRCTRACRTAKRDIEESMSYKLSWIKIAGAHFVSQTEYDFANSNF